MKKQLIILLILTVLMVTVTAMRKPDFCDGFREGYKNGYCYGKYNCIAPIAPVCPIPDIGKDTYQDGFNKGFVRGREDAKN